VYTKKSLKKLPKYFLRQWYLECLKLSSESSKSDVAEEVVRDVVDENVKI